jgi:hypothetical protein
MAEIVLRKTYTSAASRKTLEADAQMILLSATQDPVTAANIAAGSFSFAIEEDEERRQMIIRISGNERMLERVTGIARENRWRRVYSAPQRVHFPASRTERAISGGPTSEVAHPAKVNTVEAPPLRIGSLTAAGVRRGSVAEMLSRAALNVANVERTATRARRTADPRRTPAYLAAAYGAAMALLYQENAAAGAGAGAGPASAAAAMAAAEAIIREARPELTPAAVTTLAMRVLRKIERDETEPGPGERRQGGGRRTRRRRRLSRRH